MKLFSKKTDQPVKTLLPQPGIFSTDVLSTGGESGLAGASLIERLASATKRIQVYSRSGDVVAMDAGIQETKAGFNLFQNTIPDALASWYATQGFIGYQLCAIFAQQWLVDKACTMPARDAIRTGYQISLPEGVEVDQDKLVALKKMDEDMNINEQMVQFERMNRIFGIRIALFLVDSTDPEYYIKPFNIDGVTKGSYRGIAQIDPYWVTPELDFQAASNPADPNFYVPTWWRVNGQRIHRSHLVIITTGEVADILKPSYLYGGVSVPQKIYERVYAAERTANEAPLLALSKRTNTMNVDVTQIIANPEKFAEKMNRWIQLRDNYQVKVLGLDEKMEQFDTSLADLDAVIMTQYQLVAAASGVPATKLLGTQPKGFNTTGEHEESSYHEELETIQTHDLTPLLQRHHLLCIKSAISPEAPFETKVVWNALDTPTAEEIATANKLKADTAAQLFTVGAIDGADERSRLLLDPDSGYANLPSMDYELTDEDSEGDGNDSEPDEKA